MEDAAPDRFFSFFALVYPDKYIRRQGSCFSVPVVELFPNDKRIIISHMHNLAKKTRIRNLCGMKIDLEAQYRGYVFFS